MLTDPRELRQLELRALRRSDPVALLAIYRQGAGDFDQLLDRPFGVSFQEMIAAILEREESGGRPTMQPKNSSSPAKPQSARVGSGS